MKSKAKSKPAGMSVAEYFAFHVDNSKKLQKEIAEEAGYTAANIITMFKQGLTRIPIHKAPVLAKSVGIDPAHFTRMVINEYMPELIPSLELIIPARMYSHNEEEILKVIREATKEKDPKLNAGAERTLSTWAKGLA